LPVKGEGRKKKEVIDRPHTEIRKGGGGRKNTPILVSPEAGKGEEVRAVLLFRREGKEEKEREKNHPFLLSRIPLRKTRQKEESFRLSLTILVTRGKEGCRGCGGTRMSEKTVSLSEKGGSML